MKHPINGSRLLYVGLYPYVNNLLRLYFRQYKITGKENIPKNSSIILAPNHQNAFMDAITPIVNFGPGNQLSFLVRASIFGNKFGDWFLNNINIMPVYREIDGVDIVEKNQVIFDNCVWLLENKKILTMFPEGTHHVKKRMLPLKKGISRIAFTADEKNNFSLETKIIPVGIYYTRLSDFGGNLLIQFGKPIEIKDYVEIYKENPNKAHNLIKNELSARLKALMIDIENTHYYDCIDFCREIDANEKKIVEIEEEFKNSKLIIAKIQNLASNNEDEAVQLKSLSERYHEFLKKNKLRDKIFAHQNAEFTFIDFILFALLTPIGVYGWINNYLPFTIPVKVANKLIKDKGFVSSIKSAFSMIAFPIFYLLQAALVGLITWNMWIGMLYFGSLPIAFFAGLAWRRRLLKLSAQLKVNRLKNTPEFKEAIGWRAEIINRLNSL